MLYVKFNRKTLSASIIEKKFWNEIQFLVVFKIDAHLSV